MGAPVSLELFESPVLCTRLSQKIIRSWALDAIECSDEQGAFSRPTEDQIADFIGTMIAAPSKRFQVAGLGETVRFLGDKITGGALVLGNRILHVSAFSLTFCRAAFSLIMHGARATSTSIALTRHWG